MHGLVVKKYSELFEMLHDNAVIINTGQSVLHKIKKKGRDQGMKKEPTFRYFVYDKDHNPVNVDTLSPEKRKELGIQAYQRLVKELGYVPVKKK